MRTRIYFGQFWLCSVFHIVLAFALFEFLWSFELSTAGQSNTSDGSDKDKTSITIGFLTSFKSGVGKIIAGAIPLAIEYVNK